MVTKDDFFAAFVDCHPKFGPSAVGRAPGLYHGLGDVREVFDIGFRRV